MNVTLDAYCANLAAAPPGSVFLQYLAPETPRLLLKQSGYLV